MVPQPTMAERSIESESTTLLEHNGGPHHDKRKTYRASINHVVKEEEGLNRHLTLLDLVSINVGGTLGGGIFQLCGHLARNYAGPATFLSWGVGGVAACFSGLCCAELGGKIPTAGSAYAYATVTLGEYVAFVSAACLSLIYVGSASAVARSWGDKIVVWASAELGHDHRWFLYLMEPGLNFSTPAFIISSSAVWLLCKGAEESKVVTNTLTALKVSLVIFMILVGFSSLDPSNLTPMIPPEFGVSGVLHGATSGFFGFMGFDEACMLAGESINPKRDIPQSIILTITTLTIIYMVAALALTGMQPYTDISPESGFPEAMRSNGMHWAAQIASAGEIIVLPIVVLISLMAQPRLLYVMAKDGLLPRAFAETDGNGNLWYGTVVSGIGMVLIASFVPFSFLDDVLAAGQLVAFCIVNSSTIALRKKSVDASHPFQLDHLLLAFNIFCIGSGLIAKFYFHSTAGKLAFALVTSLAIFIVHVISKMPRTTKEEEAMILPDMTTDDGAYFETPFVPLIPCLGTYINWYLVLQLDVLGSILLIAYLAISSLFYAYYGLKQSTGHHKSASVLLGGR